MWTNIVFVIIALLLFVIAYLLFKLSELKHKQDNCTYVGEYSMGITRFKTPDTDIRVLQVYARDELAIALQKDGLITYKMKENYREDLKETEVCVTASINVNKIK